jgi:DNA-directed RNA polymerase subunit K/omega
MGTLKSSFDETFNYLDLVEEYNQESNINLFEKVRVMTSRAKDLYAGKTSRLTSTAEGGKPIALAQYELLKGLIEPKIQEKEKKGDFLDELEYE